jgi:uncharacterized protein involved in exopolysaccharide biosynthesis
MRGADHQQNHMFSYLSPEMRVRKVHPLRAIRNMVDDEYEVALETLETQVAVLHYDALANKVIATMHVDQDARYPAVRQVSPSTEAAIRVLRLHLAKAAGLLGAFRGGLNVQSVPSSRLIQVSYTIPICGPQPTL